MMMNEIFARYLEAGIFGSVIILLILVLRLCLRRAPRRILCLLWLLAAVRLLLPFQLESRLSLQPDLDNVAAVMGQEQDAPATNVGLPDEIVFVPENESIYQPQTQSVADAEKQHKSPIDTMDLLSIIWVSVACSAVIYMIVSYMILKFRVREAVRCEDGIMECDRIRGAFLLGYLRPKIYLPFRVSSTDRKFIIAHERAHIARGDNWWKLLGFLCASIHWYNPLVWLSYGLLCRDIELACDERVIRSLDTDERKGYSMALLNCGKSLSGASICPVAFGEVSLKTRIKSILRYRKPGLWITVIAFVLIAATAVCFLTSPVVEALPVETPEKETEALQTEQTTEASEPETSQATAQETEPETVPETTTAHIHAYTVQTVAPTCITGGYDLHTCTCGHTYQDNVTKTVEHNWVLNPKYYDFKYDTNHGQVCTYCNKERWITDSVNTYPDFDFASIEHAVLAYAQSLGFRTSTDGNVSGSVRFAFYEDTYTMQYREGFNHEAQFRDRAINLVDSAYDYCKQNGLTVSEQTIRTDNAYIQANFSEGIVSSRHEFYLYCTENKSVEIDNKPTEQAETEPPSEEATVSETTEPEETVPETEENQTEHTETTAPMSEEELLPLG